MSDYECPKCNAEYNAEYNASGGHDDDAGEQICEECGYKFIVDIEYDPSYSTRCAEHDWTPYTSGAGLVGERCRVCGGIKGLLQFPDEVNAV